MIFLIGLIALVCLLLIIIVLVQNPKGGGLSSGFSSANQIGGVRRTTDFLEKATWSLAIALMFLSVMTVVLTDTAEVDPGATTTGGTEATEELQRRQNSQGQPGQPFAPPTEQEGGQVLDPTGGGAPADGGAGTPE